MQSSFISEGTIDEHLSSYTEKYLAKIAEIRDDLYVNDLFIDGENFEQIASLKYIATEIFYEAVFKLHKWYSNVPALVRKEMVNDTDQNFAKH